MKKNNTHPAIKTERPEIEALNRYFGSPASYDASLDTHVGADKDGFIVFRLGAWNCFRDVGILPHDIILIDCNQKEAGDEGGIICSVVTDSTYDEHLDFQAVDAITTDDILDVEYLYPTAEEGVPKRRKKKGDEPSTKRVIIGLVTHVLRDGSHLMDNGGAQ